MFVFNRSVIAVLAPIALLMAVVLWSNLDSPPVPAPAAAAHAKPAAQGQVASLNGAREREG
jgi:hypothetical protein